VGLADATGNVINQYTYDLWSGSLTTSESVVQPFRYSGGMWDSSANLQYPRARWYSSGMGRFISEDTYEGQIDNPLSLNLYAYVGNNPLTRWDPTGHKITDDKYLTSSDQSLMDGYTTDFNNAQAAHDITGMQTAHDKAVALRLASGEYEMVWRTDFATGTMSALLGTPGGTEPDYKGTMITFGLVLACVRGCAPLIGAALELLGWGAGTGAIEGFTATETGIIREAQGILSSAEFSKIAQAAESGVSVTINIGGRLIQYEPGLPASGMTMFGENGFLIGNEAFSSTGELTKTVLHELYRLTTSASAEGLNARMAAQETEAAFNFAERVYQKVFLK